MPEINASVSTSNTVQPKVKWASVGAFIGAAALLAILEAARDTNLIGALPPYLSIPIGALLPAIIAFGSGWLKRNRPA